MRFPSDRCMLSLFSLDNARTGRFTPDGRQFAEVVLSDDAEALWEILPAELDELEAAGWVELLPPAEDDKPDTARAAVTPKGRYGLKRWVQQNRRRIGRLVDQYMPAETPS